MNYYNENDPNAAAWLRELITRGHIPAGHVDERSIADVRPADLAGYTQCHFFAGIGGWSLALRLAGWPDTEPIWTGSCPCQPFSVAGKGLGTADERHLWPEFARLIRECGPPVCFGEQVASADGRGWLAGVFADLEGMGYAVAGADLCAAGVSAPHIRQRLYWLADSERTGLEGHGGLADGGGLVQSDRTGRQPGQSPAEAARYGDSTEPAGFWNDSRHIQCRDGKLRRIPTLAALFPLASGLPYKLARRGSVRPALLKGAGNAIVPQVAAEFIRAALKEIRK